MPKDTQPRPIRQEADETAVLSLLNAICARNGHTFSWYTSKKGRVWFTLKGFQPAIYSTSTEGDARISDKAMLDALFVLMADHLPKLFQEAPPMTSWINAREVEKRAQDAKQYCLSIYARWQLGENLWPADYPDEPIGQDLEVDPQE